MQAEAYNIKLSNTWKLLFCQFRVLLGQRCTFCAQLQRQHELLWLQQMPWPLPPEPLPASAHRPESNNSQPSLPVVHSGSNTSLVLQILAQHHAGLQRPIVLILSAGILKEIPKQLTMSQGDMMPLT